MAVHILESVYGLVTDIKKRVYYILQEENVVTLHWVNDKAYLWLCQTYLCIPLVISSYLFSIEYVGFLLRSSPQAVRNNRPTVYTPKLLSEMKVKSQSQPSIGCCVIG